MDDLNRKMTQDDTTLINAVCAGMPLDFTSQFMSRIPRVLDAYNAIGWVHDLVPEVAEGDYQSFNAFIVCQDYQKRVVSGIAYLNRYELDFEDVGDYIAQGYDIDVVTNEQGDVSHFYTGWAYQGYDSYMEYEKFDPLEIGRLIAWRELPKYEGVTHGK